MRKEDEDGLAGGREGPLAPFGPMGGAGEPITVSDQPESAPLSQPLCKAVTLANRRRGGEPMSVADAAKMRSWDLWLMVARAESLKPTHAAWSVARTNGRLEHGARYTVCRVSDSW